ncbi:MAG TPA: 50S ribosomal protein L23 [Spirochaetia bacterium]|nr:50S ribosomal protein L23 [Spirochaetia bacterium]
MEADKVIIHPLLTEKSNGQRESGTYAFRVHPSASKIEIMSAVRQLFSVHPVSCNVMNVKGKPKRVRYQRGYTSAWKKALVTLASGEKIQIFEGA